MMSLEKYFKTCAKNIDLLNSRVSMIRIGFSDCNVLWQAARANGIPESQIELLENTFSKALELVPYYHGQADADILFRDMLIQIGSEIGAFPFAGELPGSVYFAALGQTDSKLEQDVKKLSDLFEQRFGVPLDYGQAQKDRAVASLKERLAQARDFYLLEQGAWLEGFLASLQDDLSRESFLTFLRQRILASVFSASDIAYPVKPPASTLAWRRQREEAGNVYPVLCDTDGTQLDARHFKLVYDYEQYALPGGCEPKPGDIVIDAGAFVGDTAAWFARRVGKDGRVFSFEPSQATVAQGRRNMEANHIKNVDFLCCALSDEPGCAAIIQNESSASATRIIPVAGGAPEAATIELTRLDDLREKLGKIDFIKADIEGSEMAMLRGASGTIKRDAPVCAICLYHKRDDFWQIPQYLKQLRQDYRFWFRCDAEPVLFAKAGEEGRS